MNKLKLFLGIETSTTNCSVGLFKGANLIDILEDNNGYSHSEKLGVFTKRILERNNTTVSDLEAIGVGVGPGSYTGLRIGVSFVKGLAFAHQIPIIKFTSLELMVNQYLYTNKPNKDDLLIPMIDARRNEVYCQILESNLNPLTNVHSHVFSNDSFAEYSDTKGEIICFGPGSTKLKPMNIIKNRRIEPGITPSVKGFERTIQLKYKAKCFENLAYFEPFYLKEFFVGKPKRSLLHPT